jgi:transposase
VTITPTPLPDDIKALKELLANRDALIAKLLAEIARLKRWQFGRSSERLDATLAQLQLALDDLQSAPPIAEPAEETVPAEDSTQAPPQKRVLPLRRAPRAFPAHLPRETVVHAPTSCSCPDCGGAMRHLGEDVSEMLDMVPGYFKVIRHVRPKLSCGHCSRIVQQPAPSRPIARGMAAPGLLAQIIVAKYADHCPLYRQQGIYRRSGVELDRATLAAWVGETARLLEPLVDVLGRYVLAAEKVHGDDTPVPVLDPAAARPRPGGYGRTCAMIVPPPVAIRRRCGIAIRPIARVNIRRRTCVASAAFCKPTPTPDSDRCTRVGRSWKRHAGRTHGASSTTST